MDDQFQLLFEKMKMELQKQTVEVTNTIMEKIYEKLKPVLEENKKLQIRVDNLEKMVEYLERAKKNNEIMMNKKKLKEIYITEDYAKETLDKRKALQTQLWKKEIKEISLTSNTIR